jgi:hypothetical protein
VQQYHRRRLLKQAADFRASGVELIFDFTWRDLVWLSPPASAWVKVKPVAGGQFVIGPTRYNSSGAIQQVELLRRKINAIGVTNVHLAIANQSGELVCRYFEHANVRPYLDSSLIQ